MSWKVGDRAICITPGSKMEGLEVMITSGLMYRCMEGPDGIIRDTWQYCVDPSFSVPSPYASWGAQPCNLMPIPDDKASWSELEKSLGWNPTKLVLVEIDNENRN